MEQWKNIKNYEGFYQISNLGKVKSITFRNNKTTFKREKILKVYDNGNGYLYVSLSKNNKRKNHYIHRLVAEQFLINNNSKPTINHKDYNTHNNNAKNLEWCTQKENVNHSKINMQKSKKSRLPESTKEKYIRKNNKKFGLKINHTYIGSFDDLNDAIRKRDMLLKNEKKYFNR